MLENLKTRAKMMYALITGGTVLSVAVWLGLSATDVLAGSNPFFFF
jgi:hypothetical protein